MNSSGGYTNFLRDCATDNSVPYWGSAYYVQILQDSYSTGQHYFSPYYWERNYNAIRACNQFLNYVREDVVGNAEKSGDDNRLYDRYRAEARVMRAIYHFDLVSWFGDIVLIGGAEDGSALVLDPGNESDMNMPRTDAREVLQWIADECDAVQNDLPFRYSNETENWGHVNGAAARALKIRALLYLASPLYNESNDKSLWKAAADAAEEFITKNNSVSNPYTLYTTTDNDPKQNYYECFISTPHLNPEYILSRSEWTTRNVEYYLTPCGFKGAGGNTNPTHNFVAAFETINGLPYDKDDTYDDSKPFENRDPRLEQTILHHNSRWGDETAGEARYLKMTNGSGIDWDGNNQGTKTGYYTKKYCNNTVWEATVLPDYVHACPIFRYGEVLLNAAEAWFEYGDKSKAIEYVSLVRDRVGMPTSHWSSYDEDTFRERLHNERRIELCFENHRYFDERRWKLFEPENHHGIAVNDNAAEKAQNLPYYDQIYNLYMMYIEGDTGESDGSTEGTYSFYITTAEGAVDCRIFHSPKDYYFPIPEEEVKKCSNLTQNPGW